MTPLGGGAQCNQISEDRVQGRLPVGGWAATWELPSSIQVLSTLRSDEGSGGGRWRRCTTAQMHWRPLNCVLEKVKMVTSLCVSCHDYTFYMHQKMGM